MHPDLKTVIELQQIDAKIADLSSQIDALPSQIQSLEAELNEFLHAHEDRKKRLSANQKERRALEGETQVIREKISKHKDQLYQVKTNEQYRAMLKEIENEEANLRKIEDQILEKMIEAEDLQKHVTEAGARLESEKARVATEVERLKSLRQADMEQRDRFLAQRKEQATSLNPATLALYERLHERRGSAVAEVRDGFCTACNVRLRPQACNEVRTNEVVLTCENCGRILYCVAPPPTETEAGGDNDARAAV